MIFIFNLFIIFFIFIEALICPCKAFSSLFYVLCSNPKMSSLFLQDSIVPSFVLTNHQQFIQTTTLINKIQNRYQKVHNFMAEYQRKSFFIATNQDVIDSTVEGTGRLFWSRPLFLKLEQEKPRHEIIIVQNNQVWWIRPDRARADLYSLDYFTNDLRSLLEALGGLTKIDEDFTLEFPLADDEIDNDEELTLVLKPKQARMDIKRLVLWFNPHDLLIKGFRINTFIGDSTAYKFFRSCINSNISDSTYSYFPPSDYKITDHRFQSN